MSFSQTLTADQMQLIVDIKKGSLTETNKCLWIIALMEDGTYWALHKTDKSKSFEIRLKEFSVETKTDVIEVAQKFAHDSKALMDYLNNPGISDELRGFADVMLTTLHASALSTVMQSKRALKRAQHKTLGK